MFFEIREAFDFVASYCESSDHCRITANDYWSKEHSECEKRFIQHLDKSNDLPVAH